MKKSIEMPVSVSHSSYYLAAWTAVIIISVVWNIVAVHRNGVEKARLEARTLYELNLSYRKWAAGHGGVYVPVTETLQPNPYLTVPQRDVTTRAGMELTLVNPAWMTRQVFELLAKQSDPPFLNHLTSLKYINPANRPDEWETAGLRAFEAGVPEVSDIVTLNNEPYMRLFRPFKVESSCLKCHGHQDYKVGDIRGGMSIAIPMKPYVAAEQHARMSAIINHSIIWLIGAAGIILSARTLLRKQQTLLENEEKYRYLFESSPHSMWVQDSTAQSFLTVNDAAARMYGYARDEFLAMIVSDLRAPDDDDVRAAGGPHSVDVRKHRRKDGTALFVELRSHEIEYEGRRASLVMATDVTERKRLENQLLYAQKMDAVGRLAGGVAHDFNNILTAIIGYASLMTMKMKPEEPLRHSAEEIVASAQRGAALTQSLLAFSKKQVSNPVPVNINGIVSRISKLLQRLIGEDIKLETKLASDDLTVIADSGQIEQVLMNLAANARDAMPNGGTLDVETSLVAIDDRFYALHNYGKPGSYALITMSDTGSGMDAATVDRIFEPFFTTKEVGKGTGLGLSLVYGIVKQQEGYINVYSEPGHGTTFRIYLPLASQKTRLQPGKKPAEDLRGGTETILIAEDDEPLRRLAASVLREFGYTVIEASNGEEALDKVREQQGRIHLLLLDVIMPKKNGQQVYAETRKQFPAIKILFMSGYTAEVVYKRGILDEGQEYLSKPVSPTDLLKRIRKVLDAAAPGEGATP